MRSDKQLHMFHVVVNDGKISKCIEFNLVDNSTIFYSAINSQFETYINVIAPCEKDALSKADRIMKFPFTGG